MPPPKCKLPCTLQSRLEQKQVRMVLSLVVGNRGQCAGRLIERRRDCGGARRVRMLGRDGWQ
jgi:hypothetical protein